MLKRPAIYVFIIFLLGYSRPGMAQQFTDSSIFSQPITLDEVVINSTNDGFDIARFIRIIKTDTTFYKAFKSLHLTTYNAENDIRVFENKGNKIKASLKSETKQVYRDGCRVMHVLEEDVYGNFYKKNGDYNYFTAELYANLFFTKGKVCGENNIVTGYLEREKQGKGRLEKSKLQLKHLIFNPGSPIDGIPFISNKVAIFEDKIAAMYNFKLTAAEKNGVSCFMFEAVPKPQFKKDVVINIFRTWLRQTDYAIVARDYALSYNTGIYDFDVSMHVDLAKVNGQLLPSFISYNGNWFVLTKGRERVKFNVKFDY